MSILKKIFLIIIAVVFYLLYSKYILSPQNYKYFSLIDDGQSIKYGFHLRECLTGKGCDSWKSEVLSKESGRSRFAYWVIQGLLYQGKGLNAGLQHNIRIYGFGLFTVIILVLLCIDSGSNVIGIFLAVVLFATNYSFSENYIRLGPIEPYQTLSLGLFSLFFLKSKTYIKKYKILFTVGIFLSLFFSVLLKETFVALFPTLILLAIFFSKTFNRKLVISLLITGLIVFSLSKYIFSGVGIGATYVSDYKLDLKYILQNAKGFTYLLLNSLSPFPKIALVILTIGLLIKSFRKVILSPNLIYWLGNFVFFTIILFPWKYILDRYLLLSIFSFSIFISILVTIVSNYIRSKFNFIKNNYFIFNFVLFIILSNIYFRGGIVNIVRTINYRNWFGTFTKFEFDQVKAISNYPDENMYINAQNLMDNWEIFYEIPLHLNYFYAGKPKIVVLEKNIPKDGYLFTRPSLTPVFGPEIISQYKLLDSKEYYVKQIDPLTFRENFKLKPIQTFQNPPFMTEGFQYYWEIRKL